MELLKTFPFALSKMCQIYVALRWNEKILLKKHFLENLKLADVSPIVKKEDKKPF